MRKLGIFAGALTGAGIGALAYKDDPTMGILGGGGLGAGLHSMFAGTAFPTIGGALLGGYLGKRFLPDDPELGMLGGGIMGAAAGHALFGRKPLEAVREAVKETFQQAKPVISKIPGVGFMLPLLAGLGIGYFLWRDNKHPDVPRFAPVQYPRY